MMMTLMMSLLLPTARQMAASTMPHDSNKRLRRVKSLSLLYFRFCSPARPESSNQERARCSTEYPVPTNLVCHSLPAPRAGSNTFLHFSGGCTCSRGRGGGGDGEEGGGGESECEAAGAQTRQAPKATRATERREGGSGGGGGRSSCGGRGGAQARVRRGQGRAQGRAGEGREGEDR